MYSYEVRKLVGCTCLDYVRLDDYIMVYCDDDGLTDGLETCTRINVSGTALAGNLLVVGLNEEGELTFPKPTIEEMADRFTVIRPVMDPILSN